MVDIKRGYVGRYEEHLAQQESGSALSNSSTYVSGLLLNMVCINYDGRHAVQTEATCL